MPVNHSTHDNWIRCVVHPPNKSCPKWRWWVFINDVEYKSGRSRSETDARIRIAGEIWYIGYDLQNLEDGTPAIVPGWKKRTTRRGYHVAKKMVRLEGT